MISFSAPRTVSSQLRQEPIASMDEYTTLVHKAHNGRYSEDDGDWRIVTVEFDQESGQGRVVRQLVPTA